MTVNRQRAQPDEDLVALVRRDVFGEATAQESEHLRSDLMAERWLVELTRVSQSIHAQLDQLGRGVGPDRDAQWRHRSTRVCRSYDSTIEEAKVVLAGLRERLRAGDAYTMQAELDRLRGAIRGHQRASEDADAEPEMWDLVLWSYLAIPGKKKASAA